MLSSVALVMSHEFSFAVDEAISLAIGDDFDSEAYPPVPSKDFPTSEDPELPPEPSPGYYKRLEECANRMTQPCADEIFEGIFNHGEPLTENCCRTLLDMGYVCHNGFVRVLLVLPGLKVKASEALPKSLQMWNKCVSVVEAESPAPSI